MRRETVDKLYPPFFKKLKIGPLALEADLQDLRPEFRTKLYESLLSNGWDQSQSMIVTSSDDPNLDMQIIQGRHRAIVISDFLRDGHRFDTSKILIRREDVETVDQLRAKRASYEETASLTKDPRLSKKWIDANLQPMIKGLGLCLDGGGIELWDPEAKGCACSGATNVRVDGTHQNQASLTLR